MAERLNDTQQEALKIRAKAEWNSSQDLRDEFRNNYNTYEAFKLAEAQGQVFVSAPSQAWGGQIIMFDFSKKAREAIALVRGEKTTLETSLEKALRRREDLLTLPRTREDCKKDVVAMIDAADKVYPENLRQKLTSLFDDPLKTPNFGNGFNPLGGYKVGDIDPAGLAFIFREQIVAGVEKAIDCWEWPEVVGPPRAEREKELTKLDKEIADLQGKLDALLQAAAQEGLRLD